MKSALAIALDPPDCTDESSTSEPATLRPPALVSVLRYKIGASDDELRYRIAVGDHAGALDVAQSMFDQRCVPVLVLAPSTVSLGYRELLLLAGVDGSTTLDEVIHASGLDLLDALRTLCDLLDERVLTLR